jgi:hypothetical protein
MGGLSYAHAVIFPWLDHVFNGKKLRDEPKRSERNAFVEIFRKCGGQAAGERARKLLESVRLI